MIIVNSAIQINPETAFRLIGKISAGLFTGSCISLIQEPEDLNEFIDKIRNSLPIQSYTLIASITSSIYVFNRNRGEKYMAYSAGILLSVFPFTEYLIAPVFYSIHNAYTAKLKTDQLELESMKAKELVKKWRRLHRIRALIGIAATYLLVYQS